MQAQPQGIAALGRNIPQPPMQAPQMPPMGGMGPSRAGLGTVQDRVDAYRSNPQALQQQYAVSQDMLDLLALQQIKSEKDAAMRQMQLQMAQQSPQQPTVKDQLEGQVMEMTKQDLAKQTGMVGQQQEQQKQQAMQQLMSGIARAPGAANVMPARMAGGGIIAFQQAGAVPGVSSEFGLPEQIIADAAPAAPSRRKPTPAEVEAILQEMRRRGKTIGLSTIKDIEEGRITFADIAPNLAQPAPVGDPAIDLPKMMEVRRQTQQGPSFSISDPRSAIPQLEQQLGRVGPSERAGIERELVKLRQRAATQPLPRAPEAVPTVAQQPEQPQPEVSGMGLAQPGVQPRPDIAPSLGAGVQDVRGAGIAGIAPQGGFGQRLQTAIESQIEKDPEAAEVARRKSAEDYMRDVVAKQRGVKEQGIEAIRASMAERFDPELQRREAIKQFLLSARGRGFGDVMSAGARGSLAYQQQQAEQQRAQQAALMKAQEELAGIDVSQRGKYFEAGAAERQRADEARRGAMTAGANVLGTLSQSEAAAEQLRSLETRAAAENISREKIAQIQAAAGNNSTEAERIFAEYARRRRTDPADAEQYLDTITRIKGGGKQESRLAFEALKARQTALLQELQDPLTPPQRKTEVRQELSKVQAAMDKSAGLEPTATPIYAVNPTTKQRIMSTDGGQTWKPAN